MVILASPSLNHAETTRHGTADNIDISSRVSLPCTHCISPHIYSCQGGERNLQGGLSSSHKSFALLSASHTLGFPKLQSSGTEAMASGWRDLARPLLVALCVVALFAVGSESHGLEDFGGGNTDATPAMASFFGAKPEAAQLPEVLDTSMPAKPEATSAIPATTTSTTTASAAPPRRSVSVAAGVACGVAAVAVVGVAVAVAYVVRARRGAHREPEDRLGSP